MISYKNFKQLQESFGFNLGLKSTQSLGLMGAHTQDASDGEVKSFEQLLDEAKKRAKKKMLAGGSGPVPAPDDTDGDIVDPAAVKDADPDADLGDEDGEDIDPKDNPADDEDGEGLGDQPKFSKKKMSSDEKCSDCGKSPCKCSSVKKKFKEAMMDEIEKDFFSSLKSMLAPPKTRDFRPVSEEIVFNLSDPNFGLVAQDASAPVQTITEPSAGEVGYSVDTVLGSPLGSYSESIKKK